VEEFGLLEWLILLVFMAGVYQCGKWAIDLGKIVYKFFMLEDYKKEDDRR